MNINILFSFKNYVCIKDNDTNNIWLYSYNKPLAYYKKNDKIHLIKKNIITQTNKKHINLFKKFIEENYI